MPYGTKTDYIESVSVVKRNCSPSCTSSTNSFINVFARQSWLRSGTNASKLASSGGTRPGNKSFRLKRVIVKGPKVLCVRTDEHGKARYYRERVYSLRLVPIRLKRSPKRRNKSLGLSPNPLNFQRMSAAFFGPSKLTGRYNAQYFREVEGNLWAPFTPFGAGALGPQPQNYLSSTISSSPFTNAESALATKLLPRLYEKVKNESFNAAQALGEHRQTAGMLADAVTRLAAGVKHLKRGNLTKAREILLPSDSKHLANDVLLVQYGVKPLLSDIDGAAKHLAQPERKEFNVTVRKREDIPRTLIYQESGNAGIKHASTIHTEGFVEVTYKCKIRVNSPLARDLHRLGFTDPLALAWELLPYSFVADWFIPIGDYLANMDAFSTVEVVHCTKTVFKKEFLSFTRTIGGRDGDGYTWENGSVGFTVEKVNCTRSVLPSPPVLPLPSPKDPVSKEHLLNALALLRQLKK